MITELLATHTYPLPKGIEDKASICLNKGRVTWKRRVLGLKSMFISSGILGSIPYLWHLENWCFWTVVLEKTLESPLDCKEIQPVHPKGYQSWVFTGRTEAETPILRPPHAKSWLIGKDPDAGRDWGQEEKGMTEDEMVGWHHWLDGLGFGWTPGVGDGQGGLACCGSWGRKESDMTKWLNWTESSKKMPPCNIFSYYGHTICQCVISN